MQDAKSPSNIEDNRQTFFFTYFSPVKTVVRRRDRAYTDIHVEVRFNNSKLQNLSRKLIHIYDVVNARRDCRQVSIDAILKSIYQRDNDD